MESMTAYVVKHPTMGYISWEGGFNRDIYKALIIETLQDAEDSCQEGEKIYLIHIAITILNGV